MRVKLMTLLVAVASVLFGSGCTVIRELPKQEQVKRNINDPEYKLSKELLIAFLKDDGKKFVSLLPENQQKEFPLKQYKATRKFVTESVGEPISFQYVTSLELTTFTPHIWKIRFKRVNRRTQEEFTSELLFRVITGKLDGKPIITAFQFL